MFTFHDGSLAGGAGNVNGNVMELDPYHQQVVAVHISQLGTGAVVNPEGSIDGVNFVAVRSFDQATGTGAATHSAVRVVRIEAAGLRYLRCRVASQSAGSSIIKGRAAFGALGTP